MGRAHAHPGSVLSVDTIAEPIRDNYGFLVALGGTVGGLQSLTNPTAAGALGRGIRSPMQNGDGIGPNEQPPSQNPSIRARLNHLENGIYTNSGTAFITPFEGPFCLAQ